MKVEIEVELPDDIAKDWEAIKIAIPVDGEYVITSFGDVVSFDHETHQAIARVILKRKHAPRDWWPRWLLADKIMLNGSGVIRLYADDGADGYWLPDTSNILDFSWIPEHLRRSGVTIQNPWKGEQQ